MAVPVVEVQDLEKYFEVVRPLYMRFLSPFASKERIRAVRAVSFAVGSGEILGVVGPNGAGKTTLLRILADLLEPDGGWVKLCGQRLSKSKCEFRSTIGYVSSDERSFFWRLSGRQNLEFFSRLYGMSRSEARGRITEMLEKFGLTKKADQLFRDYSAGTRKKFALIRALVYQPKVILLDEVTNSLDPPSARSVKSLAREYVSSGDGRAGVWSTHRLEEVGEICDKALVINRGAVKFFGSVNELKNKCGQQADYSTHGNSNAEVVHSLNAVLAANEGILLENNSESASSYEL
ncbi:MAG TPA: ABC transporter ATP-binding protein [Sedimentisphaerales bacterium]|nr:ABC transporter ATP-binding protein [Sedimentisphaerales bacterium]